MSAIKKSLKKLKKIKLLFKKSWRAKQRYIHYYDVLPIDDSAVLLESEHGKKLNGNIFYLVEHLSNNREKYKLNIFVSCKKSSLDLIRRQIEKHHIQNVHLCVCYSDEYFRLLASAKYLVNDTTFGYFYIKKEGQIYLNTWHGTPLKAMGRRTENEKHRIGNIQKNFIFSDFILTPNEQTRYALLHDYMVENLTDAKIIYSGYPRNVAFFDVNRQADIRQSLGMSGKTVFAYMPTFRGNFSIGGTDENDLRLQEILTRLDRSLHEDEVLLVNLHPLARKTIAFDSFTRIQQFPEEYETYEVLSICDCLVTDYSSVFFDYAVTRRKTVLFPYDYDEYMADRGTYMSFEELPFPKVYDTQMLLEELRTPRQYDDAQFIKSFCAYESINAAKQLCELVFKGNNHDLRVEQQPHNGKENVLIYSGRFRKNGITSALLNLLNAIDPTERNYYVIFRKSNDAEQNEWLKKLPQQVNYIVMMGDMDLTIRDRLTRMMFKAKVLHAERYVALNKTRIRQEKLRCFGPVKYHFVIDFNGYEKEISILLSLFDAKKTIVVHNDMLAEIKTRNNQRLDVLKYVYQQYDKVAVVGQNLIAPTSIIKNSKENIEICHNIIDYKTVMEKSVLPLQLDEETRVFPNRAAFDDIILSDKKKIISVGRFSPEKGHKRLINAFKRYLEISPDCYLIIVGGNSWKNNYQELIHYVEKMHLEKNVCLLLQVSNPFPILKACDGFILSSFYEGVPVVISEAAIVGLPVVTTDIAGTHDIMSAYGGTLVENSEDGLYQGFCMLGEGRIPRMNVNYEQYNREAVKEFEALLE